MSSSFVPVCSGEESEYLCIFCLSDARATDLISFNLSGNGAEKIQRYILFSAPLRIAFLSVVLECYVVAGSCRRGFCDIQDGNQTF